MSEEKPDYTLHLSDTIDRAGGWPWPWTYQPDGMCNPPNVPMPLPLPLGVAVAYTLVPTTELEQLRTRNKELEAQLPSLQEEGREIIQAVATADTYAYNDNSGMAECLFCNDAYGWAPNAKQTRDHDPDCLVTKARALVEQTAEQIKE